MAVIVGQLNKSRRTAIDTNVADWQKEYLRRREREKHKLLKRLEKRIDAWNAPSEKEERAILREMTHLSQEEKNSLQYNMRLKKRMAWNGKDIAKILTTATVSKRVQSAILRLYQEEPEKLWRVLLRRDLLVRVKGIGPKIAARITEAAENY